MHSMHRAAEHLFISAQGLGKIIKNLEHEYNTTFFVRSQNGVIPTDSAKLFYDWSKELVLQDAHIKTEINNFSELNVYANLFVPEYTLIRSTRHKQRIHF